MLSEKYADDIRYSEEMEAKRRGMAEGLAEGLAKGITTGQSKAILNLLEDLGEIPAALKERIYEQTDSSILKNWLKLASKSSSIEEFSGQIE